MKELGTVGNAATLKADSHESHHQQGASPLPAQAEDADHRLSELRWLMLRLTGNGQAADMFLELHSDLSIDMRA